jgi:thymidylate synthase ThyX
MEDPRPLKVTLISSTTYPLPTLYYVWEQSRSNRQLPTPQDIDFLLNVEPDKTNLGTYAFVLTMLGHECDLKDSSTIKAQLAIFRQKFVDTIDMLLNEAVPVTENIHFTFAFENCPITLREQLVRHRIGTHIDPRVGVDIVVMDVIPDLAESSWWSQTSRVVPWDTFYQEGRYILPDSIDNTECSAPQAFVDGRSGYGYSRKDVYLEVLATLEEAYDNLVKSGVPLEDARNLIPLGATHSITWNLNLKAMMHIFGKRSCWIAQANLWEEAMAQMIQELVKKVHPVMGTLLQPICMKRGKFVDCPVKGTNHDRIKGCDGDMPPCPLYLRYHTKDAVDTYFSGKDANGTWIPPGPKRSGLPLAEQYIPASDALKWAAPTVRGKLMMTDNATRFGRLWQLNAFDPKIGVDESR